MTLKICHGNGAFVVVKDGNAVIMAKGRSYCVLRWKLIREEYLNGRNAANNENFSKNQQKLTK